MLCHFVSDLHGIEERYTKLLAAVLDERPAVLLIGGDLLPHYSRARGAERRKYVREFLVATFAGLAGSMGEAAPRVLLILGNDDSRAEEDAFLDASGRGIWTYLHGRSVEIGGIRFYGYSYVPPTPFLLKDWERYDVSQRVEPWCISPEDGLRTVKVPEAEARDCTIEKDLEMLASGEDLSRAILLFHSPPHRTSLDAIRREGGTGSHAHVGSVAILRFIETRQPLVTLHGHVHESVSITGSWRDTIGRTHAFSGAHAGPGLALVRFDTDSPEAATREII